MRRAEYRAVSCVRPMNVPASRDAMELWWINSFGTGVERINSVLLVVYCSRDANFVRQENTSGLMVVMEL